MDNNSSSSSFILDAAQLDNLIHALQREGFQVVGPTVQDQAIVYDEISAASDLPQGITDDQAPGRYRLKKRKDNAYFGYVVGPHSWKKFLHPSSIRMSQMKRDGHALEVIPQNDNPPAYAFLGVRGCEMSAIQIQDKVFMGGPYVDPIYQKRREKAFIIAVNCVEARGTCFCVSMNTGPRVDKGFDIALTEIMDAGRHYFVVEEGSSRGKKIISELKLPPAKKTDLTKRDAGVKNAEKQMGRVMETKQLKEIMSRNLEHPQWDDIAERCLACANCTMVCPTCFCSTVEDVTDLTGDNAERWRKWDSCFNADFSYVAGGVMRSSIKSRFRQWMTHKLSTWHDQFGSSGCVGCGRCITWCPVGIDITKEVEAFRKSPHTQYPGSKTKKGEKV